MMVVLMWRVFWDLWFPPVRPADVANEVYDNIWGERH